MQPGADLLRQWIDRSKLTQREAADRLGFDHTFLSQILNGHRSPGLPNAVRIERVSGIAVESWLPTDDGDEEAATPIPARKRQLGKA